jgi:hypothetical protein
MTLVVAHRLSHTVRLVGDSKITDRQPIRGGYLTGALKIVILDRQICVACSGGLNRALDAVRSLDRRRRLAVDERLDIRDVEELLCEASRQVEGP